MPALATARSGDLVLTDGTRTLSVYPTAGDAKMKDGDLSVTEFLHRGRPMADGEGIIEESQGFAQLEFSFGVHDLTNGVKTAAILDWMDNTSASHASAVPGASWASTTTRTDSRATLDVIWYPHGNAVGNQKRTLPDAMLISCEPQEGSPSIFNVVMRSTTARRVERAIIT
jgi:hypothetical protein